MGRLDALDPRLVQLVAPRFFAGLSVEETAETLGMSTRTVKRDGQKARAFLHRELESR
jgi:DNA-directed RNA polymerase specialized sigma24 family protein